jgi:hypothetical protein
MKKDDLILLIITLLLLAGMLITILFGGERSRHGVGIFLNPQSGQNIAFIIKVRLDLCQTQA